MADEADGPVDSIDESDFDESDFDETDGVELNISDLEASAEAEDDIETVSYSGTDFDVEGLVRRLRRGDIVIPTFGQSEDIDVETENFQRNFVWRRPQMDRFIESLLLGYPIPGIMLVEQTDKRYLVLDGQQRLRTLEYFYSGTHQGRRFKLRNVAADFQGLEYSSLDPGLRRQLDNTFIQATIVKTDGSPTSLEAVYRVFERLNSGGTQLTPHEIRIALYAGSLVDFLAQLNDISPWRRLYGNKSPRLRDQELVLRCIALYISAATYRRPLKKYLNDFMGAYRSLDGLPVDLLRERFEKATDLLIEGPGRGSIRFQSQQVNTALAEAMIVGLMRRLDQAAQPSIESVRTAAAKIVQDPSLPSWISRATADEESVRRRLALATAAFASA